jgi:putative acetyltransferase
MVRIRASRPEDSDRVVAIWRDAVATTHHFLRAQDRDGIDAAAQEYLRNSVLWLAVDETDRPVGFMGLSDSSLEALFVDPAYSGVGVGRSLVEWALIGHPSLTVDVNEQNRQAIGFYERLGFVPTGRSPDDGEGRAYPLIHMRLDAKR